MAETTTKNSSAIGTALLLAALAGVFAGLWFGGSALSQAIQSEGAANRVLVESLTNQVDGLTRATHSMSQRVRELEAKVDTGCRAPRPPGSPAATVEGEAAANIAVAD